MLNITENALQIQTVQELPIYGLRLEIQGIINHFADVYQCPREFVTTTLFTIVSTFCGKHITIFDGKYKNHPNLWICHVADSGCNKSSPTKKMMEPLSKENGRRLENYKALREEQKNSSDMEEPTFHPLLVSDITPEALFMVMDDNRNEDNGLLLYRDELKGFIDDMGRYNNSGEISSYLSIWDGTPISITRKTQTPIYIERPFLSMIGGIQPDIIHKSFTEEMASVGFTQRWLFVYPDVVDIQEYSEASLDESYITAWEEVITALLNMGDMNLTLSPEAKQIYVNYHNETVRKLPLVSSSYKSMLSKLRIQVLKWCAIVHILSCHKAAGSGKYFVLPESTVVSAEEMQYSVECMRYFEDCGCKILTHGIPSRVGGLKMTKTELINRFVDSYGRDRVNIQKLADAIGVSRQNLSNMLNKANYKLRGCGCDTTEGISVSEDCDTSTPQPAQQA